MGNCCGTDREESNEMVAVGISSDELLDERQVDVVLEEGSKTGDGTGDLNLEVFNGENDREPL